MIQEGSEHLWCYNSSDKEPEAVNRTFVDFGGGDSFLIAWDAGLRFRPMITGLRIPYDYVDRNFGEGDIDILLIGPPSEGPFNLYTNAFLAGFETKIGYLHPNELVKDPDVGDHQFVHPVGGRDGSEDKLKGAGLEPVMNLGHKTSPCYGDNPKSLPE